MTKRFFSRFARSSTGESAGVLPEQDLSQPGVPSAEVAEIVRGIAREGLSVRAPKAAISLRLDADVLDWFRAQGAGYQTRINAVLRAYMEAAG